MQRRQLRFLLCVIYNAALPQRATPQWYCCARREFNHYRARMDLIIIGRRLLLLGRETVCEFSCAERVARFSGPARQTRLWFSEESPLAVFVLIWSALHQKNWAPRIEKAKNHAICLGGSFKNLLDTVRPLKRFILIWRTLQNWLVIYRCAAARRRNFQVYQKCGEELKWNFECFFC
jgi:hypothetical protein